MTMAKDKGKKKSDEKASKKSKGGDGFAKPSEAPAGGDGWRLETDEHLGDLFMITPLREQTVKGFEDADTQVIVCSIVHIDEKKPAKSEEHEEVWVWARWIQGSLRGYIGEQRVLGRLAKDKSKAKGNNAAWVLEDADDDDVEIATKYLEFINNPLNKTGKKSKSEPEKKSKGDDAKASKKSKAKPEPEKSSKKKKDEPEKASKKKKSKK